MAETLGAVVGVVAFGLNLATTLQTYTELTREANDALHDVVFEVNATASALRQLQAIVDADKAVSHLDDSPARVLNDSGVREIENLAAKCETVYKTIVKLVQKASGSESDPPNATAASQHALDPASLKPMTVLQRLRWPWLTPRIERCQQQLRWLKISLLVTLQVANLALQQMRRDNDPISTQANSLTDVVQTLQERQVELAKKLAGFSQTSLEDAANLRAWKAAYGTETGFSEASSIPGRKSHLTAVGHVTGKPKDINGVEQAVKTEANPKPGTISGVGTAPVQATDDRDAPVDELKKPASTRDMGIGTGIEPEKRGLPEAGAAVATNPEPPSATMATTSQVAHEPASLGIQRMAPEPLPKAAHVKMHSKASEPSKKRRTIPLFSRFRKVPDLQSQLFGEDDKFSHDPPSRTLEAFVAELGMIRKVPFGHDRLVYGLNQVHKHRLIATWAKYLNSSAEKQALIGKITDMAKRTSHRAMSLLTFHEIERPDGSDAILAFFALNQLQEPVTFIDAEVARGIVSVRELLSRLTNAPSATT
ncbi:hypothetical protein VFPFJ_07857 [Purpureocillium lilacinum]|uniref:Fungal N-terminal domain-containing protein n=1 Tax=Purpureocillium lilacinum TaxID=33203 RepID=A0A179H6S8_PURLI|nr:hypothetical protein VFPFJ_07857 [Purpureocillium lilacinum]OAQ85468.1 hypothetical protein VFPFJ_07857 [Purpureocillium lilacinum]